MGTFDILLLYIICINYMHSEKNIFFFIFRFVYEEKIPYLNLLDKLPSTWKLQEGDKFTFLTVIDFFIFFIEKNYSNKIFENIFFNSLHSILYFPFLFRDVNKEERMLIKESLIILNRQQRNSQ